jgi:hypothetical protein
MAARSGTITAAAPRRNASRDASICGAPDRKKLPNVILLLSAEGLDWTSPARRRLLVSETLAGSLIMARPSESDSFGRRQDVYSAS